VRKWTDSLLRVAIVRAAQSFELVYSDPHEEKKRIAEARRLMRSWLQADRDISPELVVAEMTEKFPNLNARS
jgi:hypothetical protein